MTQHRSSYVLARNLPIDGGTIYIRDLKPKSYLCIHPILVEDNICPRSCAMKPSDEDYVFHLYPQSTLLRKSEPGVDMLNYPFAELFLGEGVFTQSRDGKGQHGTVLASARKRGFHRAWRCGPEETSATSAKAGILNITRRRGLVTRQMSRLHLSRNCWDGELHGLCDWARA